jgi:hypothetical protein
VDFSTNADSGGNVYIYSSGALTSTAKPGTPINSVSAGSATNLGSTVKGYGAQVTGATSLTVPAPYNSSGNIVGSLATIVQPILSSSTPVSSGSATIQLQAKADTLTKSASDYTDTITVVAAATF